MNRSGECDIFDCLRNKAGICEVDGYEFGSIEKDGTGIVILGPKNCYHRKFKNSFRDQNSGEKT